MATIDLHNYYQNLNESLLWELKNARKGLKSKWLLTNEH